MTLETLDQVVQWPEDAGSADWRLHSGWVYWGRAMSAGFHPSLWRGRGAAELTLWVQLNPEQARRLGV